MTNEKSSVTEVVGANSPSTVAKQLVSHLRLGAAFENLWTATVNACGEIGVI